ncbi:WD40 repeat protein [Giardia muris]|uniref:WD40 repeat protein n=1 Tax=Giardia muris TaxID=5742 RepID=A0A4Z1SYE5_GIAMU|nr:WD40 repeat protein [Giardia muris]|eukprot:TNJ30510.1 WD40 repeat protein [Giardia muris]
MPSDVDEIRRTGGRPRRPTRVIWSLEQCLRPAHADSLTCLATIYSENQALLVTGSLDKTISLWRRNGVYHKEKTYQLDGVPLCIAQGIDTLIITCGSGHVYVLVQNSLHLLATVPGAAFYAAALHPLQQVVVVTRQGSAYIIPYLPIEEQVPLEHELHEPSKTMYVACSALLTQIHLAYVCEQGYLCVYDLSKRQIRLRSRIYKNMRPSAMASTYSIGVPSTIFTSGADGSLSSWSVVERDSSLELIEAATKSTCGATVLSISLSDPRFVLVGLGDAQAKIYEIDNLSHSIGICRGGGPKEDGPLLGLIAASWLGSNAIVAASRDRGIYVYSRFNEGAVQAPRNQR